MRRLLPVLFLAVACTTSSHKLPESRVGIEIGDTPEEVAAALAAEGAERVQLVPDLDDYQFVKAGAVRLTAEQLKVYDHIDLNYPVKGKVEPGYCALRLRNGVVDGVLFDTQAPKSACPTTIRAGDTYGEVIAVVTAQLRTGELESVTLAKDARLLGDEVAVEDSGAYPTWRFRSRASGEPVMVSLTFVDGKVKSITLLPTK
jgi:hypothetical protein